MIEKHKRRWFQFSLRTFLVTMTVLGIWLGLKINAARQQHEAVMAIHKAGGLIAYSYQIVPPDPDYKDFRTDPGAAPSAPAWLRNVLGDDFLFDVVFVGFGGKNKDHPNLITESDLAQLTKLPRLRGVSLNFVTIAANETHPQRLLQDGDLAVLKSLDRLEWFWLGPADVHGKGLENLKPGDRLTFLRVEDTPLDDFGMKQIGRLSNLVMLAIRNTRITDSGLENLKSLSALKWLCLDKNQINGSGLTFLRSTNLWELFLCQTTVDNNGLQTISQIKTLTRLLLSGSQRFDAIGLKYLKGLPDLDTLGLNLTAISDDDLPILALFKKLATIDLSYNADWYGIEYSDIHRLSESYHISQDGIQELRYNQMSWMSRS